MSVRGTLLLIIAIAAISGFGSAPLQAKWSWSSLNPFRSDDAKSGSAAKSKAKGAAIRAKSGAPRSAAPAAKKSKKSPSGIDKTTGALKFGKSTKPKKSATSTLARTSGKPPLKKTKETKRPTPWFGGWFGANGESDTQTVPGWTPAKGDKESR